MVIDASFIINCCITLKKLQDKSPLFRIAESEVIIAQEIFEHIEEENSEQNALHRILTHLESAYCKFSQNKAKGPIEKITDELFHDCIKCANEICISIAIIHYKLGNIKAARHWIIDRTSSDMNVSNLEGKTNIVVGNVSDDVYKIIQDICGKDFEILQHRVNKEEQQDDTYSTSDLSYGDWYFTVGHIGE